MASLARSFGRAPRARFFPSSIMSTQPKRFAHSSYGNEQSGQEQGTHEKNPMEHMEHPGPKAPDVGSSNSSSGSSGDSSQSATTSDGSKPKIQGDSASQDQSAEVKQHNKEMEQRADRSANQLSEEDNKVDKKFWKGDVGDMDQQAEKKD